MKSSFYIFGKNVQGSFFILCILSIVSEGLYAQKNNENLNELKESKELMSDASLALQKDEFNVAEADYRVAIGLILIVKIRLCHSNRLIYRSSLRRNHVGVHS